MLSATAKTLSTPLPRVYDKDVRTGQAVATFESLSERERLALTEEEINLRDLEAIKHHTVSAGERGKQRGAGAWGIPSSHRGGSAPAQTDLEAITPPTVLAITTSQHTVELCSGKAHVVCVA